MAQALFDALGVAGMDTQTAMAVQSLLESQSLGEATAQVDDDDVFQCGKCKKTFTSLPAFVDHKQTRCTQLNKGITVRQSAPVVGTNTNTAFTTTVPQVLNKQQPVSVQSIVPQSPLGQSLTQNMVLTEDLMTFNVDQNLQASTLQVGSTSIHGNPFLSVGPPMQTVRSTSSGSPTFNTVSASYPNNSSASSVFVNSLQSGQITLPQGNVSVADHNHQANVVLQAAVAKPIIQVSAPSSMSNTLTLPAVVKPSPTKPATRKLQATSSGLTIVESGEDGGLITVTLGEQTMEPHTLPPPPPVPQVGNTQSAVTKQQRRTKTAAAATAPPLEDGSSKKKLKCQYCDKTFSKNFDLQQHVRSHTGEKPFQCIVCGRAFAQKSNVKKHMQTHKVWPQGSGKTLPDQPEPETLSENPCTTTVDVPMPSSKNEGSTIEISITDQQSEKGKLKVMVDNSYICQYCKERFKSYFQLKSHMVQHKAEQVYKCVLKQCGMTFSELDGFLEHTKTHEEALSYRCHMCNKNFPSLYELGVHQYSHSLYPNQGPKPGPRYFRCNKCNNKYSTPEALQHHLETTEHSYQCKHCDKTFTCERYLRRHLPVHGTIGEHVCDVCNKRFKTEQYLKMHLLIHSGEKPFKCDQCDASFNRKDKLKRHLMIHEPVKKYKCPFKSHTGCTKEFHRPDKLKAHIISHSGIKPYKCPICNKSFSRKPHLREHEQSHRDEYKFRCETCNRGFVREKYFQVHKCQPITTKYRSSSSRRKMGRPKKKVITVTEESLKQTKRQLPSRRGRPRKTPLPPEPAEDPPTPPVTEEEGEGLAECDGVMHTEEEMQSPGASVVPLTFDPRLALSQGSTVIISQGDMPLYSGAGEGGTSTQEIVVMHPMVVSNGDGKSQVAGPTFASPMESYGLGQPGQQIRIIEPVSSMTGGQQGIQYQEVEHQNMAFIPTAPGQATLVVAGPTEVIGGGAAEVITQDGIATIVATGDHHQIVTSQSAGDHHQIVTSQSVGDHQHLLTGQSAGDHHHLVTGQSVGDNHHLLTSQSAGDHHHIVTGQSIGDHHHLVTSQSIGDHHHIVTGQSAGEHQHLLTGQTIGDHHHIVTGQPVGDHHHIVTGQTMGDHHHIVTEQIVSGHEQQIVSGHEQQMIPTHEQQLHEQHVMTSHGQQIITGGHAQIVTSADGMANLDGVIDVSSGEVVPSSISVNLTCGNEISVTTASHAQALVSQGVYQQTDIFD